MLRERSLVPCILALLAGCSSSAPRESVSHGSAAVVTPMASLAFHQILGTTAADVGSDSLGINWVAKSASNGQEYSWGIGTPLAGTPVGNQSGVAIDLGAQGPWVITAAHDIYGSINGSYGHIAGQATDVGVSPDGNTIYVVGVASAYSDVDFPIYKWVNGGWTELPWQFGIHIDAANDGTAYVTDHTGAVWHIAGTPSNPVTTYFGPSGTNATDVTIGADGTIFVVGNNGAGNDAPIYVYDPQWNSWDPLPGATGMRVSASSATVVSVAANDGTIWTTAGTTCGGLLDYPCPGNACASGLNPDPNLGGTCAHCGGANQPCCGSTCYASGTTCGGNSTLNTPSDCVAPCGAPAEGACVVNSGNRCQPNAVLEGNSCLACGANNTVLLNNVCLPRSRTWTFPETDGTDIGVHPQTLTVNWDGSWSWQGQFWMNYGFYWSGNDIVVIALTTSDGHVYYLQHTGSLSGFGNSSDPANGDWNDFGNGTYSPVSGNWAEIVNASAKTKGELNTTAGGILGDLGIVAVGAVMIGAASY